MHSLNLSLCYNVIGYQPETTMATKLKDVQALKIERPKRAKLTEEETLKRMESFDERKEQFVASVRKDKN